MRSPEALEEVLWRIFSLNSRSLNKISIASAEFLPIPKASGRVKSKIRIRIKVMRTRNTGYWVVLDTVSVADPGCLSSILNPKSRIQKQQQKRGVKKICCHFFIAINFTKLKIILFLKCWRKNLGRFSKNYRTFYPKKCH